MDLNVMLLSPAFQWETLSLSDVKQDTFIPSVWHVEVVMMAPALLTLHLPNADVNTWLMRMQAA